MTAVRNCLFLPGMSNVLSEEKRQQVLALGRLGWSLRPIGELPPGLESIHPSVRERYERLDGYRPKKLVELLEANPEAAWQTARAARVE